MSIEEAGGAVREVGSVVALVAAVGDTAVDTIVLLERYSPFSLNRPLVLSRNVTIVAEAGARATLNASASAEAPRRVLLVGGAGTVVRLRSVDVTGGFVNGTGAWGGGVRVQGGSTLLLDDCGVRGNVMRAAGSDTAAGGGIAILPGSAAVLTETLVEGNEAASDRGPALGGGVFNFNRAGRGKRSSGGC